MLNSDAPSAAPSVGCREPLPNTSGSAASSPAAAACPFFSCADASFSSSSVLVEGAVLDSPDSAETSRAPFLFLSVAESSSVVLEERDASACADPRRETQEDF